MRLNAFALPVAIAASLATVPMMSAQPAVWSASSLERIPRTAGVKTQTDVQMYAAKGEQESFQIVVSAVSAGLTGVRVSVSDLVNNTDGTRISSSNLTLYREHYVNVGRSSPDWQGTNRPHGVGAYADALIPFVHPVTKVDLTGVLDAQPFSVQTGQNVPVWVDVAVPRDAAAGLYTGTYDVTWPGGSATGNVTLTVWNFALPLKPALKTAFAFWKTPVQQDDEELLKHRISPTRPMVGNERAYIDTFGLQSVHLGFWSGADQSTCTMSAAPSAASIGASKATHQTDLQLYNYTADEIGSCGNLDESLKSWARNLHANGIRQLVTMKPKTTLFDDGSGTGAPAVDYWVMLPLMYDQSAGLLPEVLRRGQEIWSYNALVQDSYSPKWMIDFDSVDLRIQPGFMSQALSLTGLLYWRVDMWSSDPWNVVDNTGTFSPENFPGDGMLVYPGTQVGTPGVAPSLRLKWLRDGIDDYDYMELLKQKGRGDWAKQVSSQAATNWMTWTRDKSVIESVRQQLGNELDQLNGCNTSVPVLNAVSAAAPVLTWQAAAGATSYDVYLGTATAQSLVGSTTGTTSYTPSGLTPGTTYGWKVVARTSNCSRASAAQTFTTANTPLAAPVLTLPANNATSVGTTTALTWSATTGATGYDIYLGEAAPGTLAGTVTATTWQASGLVAGKTYYWRVVAKAAGGATATSSTWSFSTASASAVQAGLAVTVAGIGGRSYRMNATYSNTSLTGMSGFNVLVNSAVDGRRACWLYYDKNAKTLSLASDASDTWSQTAAGSGTVVSNSQCEIKGSTVAVTTTATSLALRFDVTMKPAFAGAKIVYGRVIDSAAPALSDYVQKATLTIP